MTIRHPVIASLTAFALLGCNESVTKAEPPMPDYATAQMDLSTPIATAHSMMMAMYRGDADMIDKIFAENGTLTRVKADGTLEPDGLKRWRDWVGTLEVGQAHEEIFALETEEFANLATVWAPFVISVNGEIVGCGVNQLSMAKDGANWRVVSGMDTPAPNQDCATFKERYLTDQ